MVDICVLIVVEVLVKLLTVDEVKVRIIQNFGNDYSLDSFTVYEGCEQKIELFCNKCNVFFTKAVKRLIRSKNPQGCQSCGERSCRKLKTSSQNKFENKVYELYKDKYDLSLCIYTKAKNYITVICKKHGSFVITPNNLLRGKGCVTCGREVTYLHRDRMYSPLFNEKYKYSYLYVVRLYNSKESFYKIGISVTPTARLKRIAKESGYAFETLLVIKGLVNNIPKLEYTLHKLIKSNRCIPSNYFAGSITECFSNIDGILDHIPFDKVEVITDLLSQQEIAA